jgi:hypothetical protein
MVSRRKRARLRYLRKWHDRYMHMTPGILGEPVSEAKSDEPEHALIEAWILDMQATVCVENRFCSECQQMLDDWPDVMSQTRDQRHIIRQYHTIFIEAGARNGCQFCAYVWQFFRDTEMIDLYRQVELRLEALSARNTSSLSIGYDENGRPSLNLTLPGLDDPEIHVLDILVEIGGCTPNIGSDSGT